MSKVARLNHRSVMAGLDPAAHRARVARKDSLRRADARRMDGRLEAAHDESGV